MKSMNDFAAIATRRENFTVASSSRCFHPTIYPIALLFFPLPTNLFPFFFFTRVLSSGIVFLFRSLVWTI